MNINRANFLYVKANLDQVLLHRESVVMNEMFVLLELTRCPTQKRYWGKKKHFPHTHGHTDIRNDPNTHQDDDDDDERKIVSCV